MALPFTLAFANSHVRFYFCVLLPVRTQSLVFLLHACHRLASVGWRWTVGLGDVVASGGGRLGWTAKPGNLNVFAKPYRAADRVPRGRGGYAKSAADGISEFQASP